MWSPILCIALQVVPLVDKISEVLAVGSEPVEVVGLGSEGGGGAEGDSVGVSVL